MLKIKDNVDLKEIGFYKDEEDFIWGDDWFVLVDKDTRIISYTWTKVDKALDRIYDLIKADLVEKVEGSDE